MSFEEQENILIRFLSVSRKVATNIWRLDLNDLQAIITQLEALLERSV